MPAHKDLTTRAGVSALVEAYNAASLTLRTLMKAIQKSTAVVDYVRATGLKGKSAHPDRWLKGLNDGHTFCGRHQKQVESTLWTVLSPGGTIDELEVKQQMKKIKALQRKAKGPVRPNVPTARVETMQNTA